MAITRATIPVIFTIPSDLGGTNAFMGNQGITQLTDILVKAMKTEGWDVQCGWGTTKDAGIVFELHPLSGA